MAHDLVEEAQRGSDDVGAVVGPEEAVACLLWSAARGFESLGAAFTVDVVECLVVFDRVFSGGVGDDVFDGCAVDGALDCDALGCHAVEWCRIDLDGFCWSIWVVDIHRHNPDWVGWVVIELEAAWDGAVGILIEAWFG